MKRSKEAYLDALLRGKKEKSLSAREYLLQKQDEVPLVILTAYLNSIHERAVINDGRIVSFQR